MKAIVIHRFGEPDVMQIVEKKTPKPQENEVIVRVRAIGVNPVETYVRAGNYPVLPELPYTPGGNIAGVIESCGAGVENLQVGDRVYSGATLSGSYAEKALCRSDQVYPLSENLSFSQGAALGVPAATAWRALFIRGQAKRGERVLIHGASGSVGQAAIQLARGIDLEIFGTAGTDKGCEIIKELGAQPFRHDKDNYEAELGRVTGGTGFDLILEMVANQNLEKDLNLLAAGGRVIIIGSRGRIEIDPRATMGRETEIRGVALLNATREELQQTHAGLAKAIEKGKLVPRISGELRLVEAAKAHELVMCDGNCGKIVLLP